MPNDDLLNDLETANVLEELKRIDQRLTVIQTQLRRFEGLAQFSEFMQAQLAAGNMPGADGAPILKLG